MNPEKESAPIQREAEGRRSTDKPIALVLIENNGLSREGLAVMLTNQRSFHVRAAVGESDDALEAVRRAKPDVVLIGAESDYSAQLKLVDAVRKEAPHARVIVKGVQPDHRDVTKFFCAGVSAFILKGDSLEELSATIRCIAAGYQMLPPTVIAALAQQFDSREVLRPTSTLEAMPLTAREQQVVVLLGEGLCNKAIAQRLGIAVHTVKSHVHNVLAKLELSTRLEVAAYAHAHHIPLVQ